jgi:Na+/melibiose symporter-like transporter
MPKKGMATELRNFFVGVGYLLRWWDYMSLAMLSSLGWVSIYFVQNNLYLYAKYAMLEPNLFDPVLLVALASCAIMVPLWAVMLSYLSKRKTAAVGIVWLMCTWVVLIVLPAGNVPLAFVVAVFSGGGIAVRGAPTNLSTRTHI